jgi:hypothetical protein
MQGNTKSAYNNLSVEKLLADAMVSWAHSTERCPSLVCSEVGCKVRNECLSDKGKDNTNTYNKSQASCMSLRMNLAIGVDAEWPVISVDAVNMLNHINFHLQSAFVK